MTDRICNSLDKINGIINAYSWPTGMRNDGPEEYSIYFDPSRTEFDTVATALQDRVEQHITNGVHITTQRSDPGDRTRVNVGMDEEKSNYPSLTAQVIIHEDAHDLQELAKNIDGLVFWNVEWDVEACSDVWHDPRYLFEHPDTGVLNVFFELTDTDQYDAVIDLIENTVSPKSVSVSQADSDGFYVQITQT